MNLDATRTWEGLSARDTAGHRVLQNNDEPETLLLGAPGATTPGPALGGIYVVDIASLDPH